MSKDSGPRDWDKELAEIDKLISASGGNAAPKAPPPAKPAGRAPASGASAPAARAAAPGGKRDAFFTWLRVVLGLTLGVAMTQWPYVHGCGLQLAGYLAGVAAVIVAGFWSTLSSWRSRSALAHGLSIALLFWGTTLAAREVLPRVGYAKEVSTWACVTTPAPAQASPAQASPAQAAPSPGVTAPVDSATTTAPPAPAADSAPPAGQAVPRP